MQAGMAQRYRIKHDQEWSTKAETGQAALQAWPQAKKAAKGGRRPKTRLRQYRTLRTAGTRQRVHRPAHAFGGMAAPIWGGGWGETGTPLRVAKQAGESKHIGRVWVQEGDSQASYNERKKTSGAQGRRGDGHRLKVQWQVVRGGPLQHGQLHEWAAKNFAAGTHESRSLRQGWQLAGRGRCMVVGCLVGRLGRGGAGHAKAAARQHGAKRASGDQYRKEKQCSLGSGPGRRGPEGIGQATQCGNGEEEGSGIGQGMRRRWTQLGGKRRGGLVPCMVALGAAPVVPGWVGGLFLGMRAVGGGWQGLHNATAAPLNARSAWAPGRAFRRSPARQTPCPSAQGRCWRRCAQRWPAGDGQLGGSSN